MDDLFLVALVFFFFLNKIKMYIKLHYIYYKRHVSTCVMYRCMYSRCSFYSLIFFLIFCVFFWDLVEFIKDGIDKRERERDVKNRRRRRAQRREWHGQREWGHWMWIPIGGWDLDRWIVIFQGAALWVPPIPEEEQRKTSYVLDSPNAKGGLLGPTGKEVNERDRESVF